jgi:hypothetical protein
MYHFDGGSAEKVVTFFTTFFKQKTVFGALIEQFFTV